MVFSTTFRAELLPYTHVCHRLSHDILVSHSAPALMRGESVDDMYDIPGTGRSVIIAVGVRPDFTVSVWMWLAFKRFLPDGRVRRIMRVPLNVRVFTLAQF